MNVLVASHMYPSRLSAISGSFVHNQVRFLQAHCDLQVVAPRPWFPLAGFGRWSAYRSLAAAEVMEGVPVCRPAYLTLPRRILLGTAWRSYYGAVRRVVPAVPDLIHGHCAYPDGRAAVEIGRALGRPAVITVHGHDLKDLARGAGVGRRYVSEALRAAAAVIAVSGELERLALELGARRVVRIPNGVDCDLFVPGARRPGTGGWRLIYVGRYDPAKGIGVLLEALAQLRAQGRDVRLDLVGGSAATGSGEPFRRQVQTLGLAERVSFVDAVPWAELPGRLGASDVFVLPSFSEGLPLSLLEALACGLPVVTTRCGGPEEVVREQTGRLVAPGDVEGLTDALGEVLDGYPGYDRGRIRQYAKTNFDYRSVADRIHALYEDVVSSYSASTSR